MNNRVALVEVETKKLLKPYLRQESASCFSCKPALQDIFLQALPLIRNSTNPFFISTITNRIVPSVISNLFYRLLFKAGSPGYVVLLDLPVECAIEDSFSAALTSLVSFPVMYPEEGGLIISIKPHTESAPNPSFANAVGFNLHTDLSYVSVMPDVLTMCVKKIARKGGGETLISTIDDVYDLLDSHAFRELRQNQFLFSAPAHYKTYRGLHEILRPVITDSFNGLRVRFRYDKVKAQTKAGEEAIELFNYLANRKKQQFLLPKYSGILINQRFALHGRTEFTPTYDSSDRELTRCYGTTSKEKYKSIDYATGAVACED
jgi:hypothetical protein